MHVCMYVYIHVIAVWRTAAGDWFIRWLCTYLEHRRYVRFTRFHLCYCNRF